MVYCYIVVVRLQYLLWVGLPTLLWMLGNLIHLLRSSDFNTYPQHNTRLNNHLRVDAWLMLLLAITVLAFPRQLLSLIVRSFRRHSLLIICCCSVLDVSDFIFPTFIVSQQEDAG